VARRERSFLKADFSGIVDNLEDMESGGIETGISRSGKEVGRKRLWKQ
jgi:hypothetical protein